MRPFDRHDGKFGLELGVDATKLALNDCGREWSNVEAAFGGSSASGNADALMPRMGLTGIQFINVANGCATGGSAVLSAYWAIKAGEFDTALAVGFDKHPRGSFNPDRSEEHTSELPSLMRTSYAVFCLKKKQKYMTT